MAHYRAMDALDVMIRRGFMAAVAAGAVVLMVQLAVTAEPDGKARTSPAAAYAEYLRSTKGIEDIWTVHRSDAGSNGVDVVIVSAGFTAAEQDDFRKLSEQFAASLLSMEPWNRYRRAVNVHAVYVVDESTNVTRLAVSGHEGHVLSCNNEIAAEYAGYAANPAGIAVLHNSAFSTAACGPWGVVTVNRTAARNAGATVHELGHGMAGLGDEYIQRSGPFSDPPESLQDTINVTAEPNPRLCKWHYWTEEQWPGLFKPLKLPEGRVVANFEGAGWPAKIYRPEATCMMRGNRNCFCVVCNENMEASLFRRMNLFKTVEPEREDIVLWKGESVDFRINAIDFIREPPEWMASRLDLYLDGKRVASSDRGDVTFHFGGRSATPGIHQLGANLNVQADLVRRDFGFLSASRAWRVKVIPQKKPVIVVKSVVSIEPGGEINVPVAIQHSNPALFGLKMTHSPSNAVFENGRFKWQPAGAIGSWRVDFTASFEQQDVVTESMEIRIVRADGAKAVVEAKVPETINAVAGERLAVGLKADAADGGHLLFEPVDAPAGVKLDRYSGELTWTPLVTQAGPQLVRVRVRSGSEACEINVPFRVRRPATPSSSAYYNKHIPRTQEYIKQLQQSPLLYQRIFENIRLMRQRWAAVYDPALDAAEKMYKELPPELRENCIQEISLHAWAFMDKPKVLKWMRSIAVESKSDHARELGKKLDLIDDLKSLRTIETSGGPAELAPLMERLIKTSDGWIRSSIERAIEAICVRAEDKDACRQAILGSMAKANGSGRVTLLPLLGFVRTPAAMEALMAAANDQDKDVAAKAIEMVGATGGMAQLAPLLAMLVDTSDGPQRSAVERAARAICGRMEDKDACQQVILPVLARAKGPSRAALVRLLPRVKTPAAMEAWTSASKDAEKEVSVAGRQSLDYVNGIGATDAYVASWLVSGPYVGAGGGAPFDDVFIPEKDVGKAEWQACEVKNEKGALVVRLGKMFSGDYRAAYMKTVVQSEREQEVLFEIGSDDGIKAWLNGKLIFANNADRPLKPAQDKFKGTLKKGDNTLLCKIIQRVGEWGGCVRIRSADGGDALGVSARAK